MKQAGLFVTCLAEQFYPRAAIAVVKVLEAMGWEVAFPKGQTCCGQPMWNNGLRAEAKAAAKRMIEVFDVYETVVTPSGSCAAMVREYYVEMFKGDAEWEARARGLAERTYEFVEFLTKRLKVDLRELEVRWEGKATYHYSCHLRGIGMGNEAVELMKQIEGLEYVELEKMDQCCGFGGTFAVKFSEVSGALARDKVACIRKTGAAVVVSNDSGCTMNLSGTCRREGLEVRFMSLAEIIAEGMGLLEYSGEGARS